MKIKPVDKTKKTNIKCEHCKHWQENGDKYIANNCGISGELKNYWNRCKVFEWK